MPMPHSLTRREFLVATFGLAGLLSAPRGQGHPRKEKSMEFYVSPQGKDTWSGTRPEPDAAGKDGPFATLEAARDAIRLLKRRGTLPAGGVRVLLAAATYERRATFALTAEDSGTAAAPVSYEAFDAGLVRISGGQAISGFIAVENPAVLARLDEKARGQVLQCDLAAQGITDYGSIRPRGFNRLTEPVGLELFYDDLPMPLARWPNEGWAKVIQGSTDNQSHEFTFTALRPHWAEADDLWLYAYWQYDWADTYDRVKRVDLARKTISLHSGGDWGIRSGARFRVLNVLEELDAPGEWYLDRKTLTPAGNFATGNDIYDSNRLARTYRPGIAVDGVGNHVTQNHIHDLPHFGVWLHGNDHVIERNEIDHVCLDTNDAGAFYMGRDFTERGNIIRENYFHDLGEGDLVQAVYLDDCASGATIERNIFVRAGRGMMIGGGRDNIVTGNAFVECQPAIHLDGRGIGWASFWFNGKDPTLLKRLAAVAHDRPPYSRRYPELVRLLDDQPAFPKGNRVTGNLSVDSRWLDLLDGLTEDDLTLTDNIVYPG